MDLTPRPTWMLNRFLRQLRSDEKDYNRQENCKKRGKTIGGEIINGSKVLINATRDLHGND